METAAQAWCSSGWYLRHLSRHSFLLTAQHALPSQINQAGHLHARGALSGKCRGPGSHSGLRAQQGCHGCSVRHPAPFSCCPRVLSDAPTIGSTLSLVSNPILNPPTKSQAHPNGKWPRRRFSGCNSSHRRQRGKNGNGVCTIDILICGSRRCAPSTLVPEQWLPHRHEGWQLVRHAWLMSCSPSFLHARIARHQICSYCKQAIRVWHMN